MSVVRQEDASVKLKGKVQIGVQTSSVIWGIDMGDKKGQKARLDVNEKKVLIIIGGCVE